MHGSSSGSGSGSVYRCIVVSLYRFLVVAADDAAVITGQESENQHLLNRFSLWCQWSDMIIRVDKCSTFGIKKVLTRSAQYLPKLLIGNRLIPSIKIGESFKYLGRFFDFDMSDKEHKSELISLVNELMNEIDLKPLHPKNKLLLYNRHVISKISCISQWQIYPRLG